MKQVQSNRPFARVIVTGAVLSVGAIAPAACAELLTIELNDIASWAEEGNAGNWVLNTVAPDDRQIVGFGYDLTLTTFGASWLSEAVISIADTATPASSYQLTPGAGFDVPGENAAFSSGGIIAFDDLGLPAIPVLSNSLRLEFFETFVDNSASADAVWNGTLTLDLAVIPAPGAGVIVLLGALTARRRRRAAGGVR